MKKLRNLTAKEILEILKKDRWYIVKQKGSHVQLKHPEKQFLFAVVKPCQSEP